MSSLQLTEIEKEQERSAYWKDAFDSMAERSKEMGEEMEAISKEVGCVFGSGIALRFVKQLRADLGKAHTRNEELIRSWDKASPTERQELDRLRRGWGPSTPTERQARQADLLDAKTTLSLAMEELVVPEGDISDGADLDERLNESYAQLSKGYQAICEKLQNLAGLERYETETLELLKGAETKRDRYYDALTEIRDAGTAHGMPAADMVEAMRDIAKGAIGPRKTIWAKDDRPGGFDGPTAAE